MENISIATATGYLPPPPSPALTKIEAILDSIASDLIAGRPLRVPIYPRPRSLRYFSRTAAVHNESQRIPSQSNARANKFVFPGAIADEPQRFAVMIKILDHMHRALSEGVVVTKRDIYYQDPELFGKQGLVDKYVDDIAYTLGVQRSALNVVAAPRGLALGPFKIRRADGSIVDGNLEAAGMLVPTLLDTDRLDISDVSWVLVIEKEATFRTLAQCRAIARSPRKGILITAKGYPDRATRVFLRALSITDSCVPIYALADYDPDGLAIVTTYAFGSVAMAHESSALATPRLEWLGIKSEDVVHREIQSETNEEDTALIRSDDTGVLRLTERDRAKARAILERHAGRLAHQTWLREVRVMLMLSVKAEIQALDRGVGLEAWISSKLRL